MNDFIRDLQRLYYQGSPQGFWSLQEIAGLSGLDKATVWRLIHGRLR